MLLVSMLAILFVFSLAGMEIAWAIGLSAFIFILLLDRQHGKNLGRRHGQHDHR